MAPHPASGDADEVVQFGGRRGNGRWPARLLFACLVGAAAVVVILRAASGPAAQHPHVPAPPPPVKVTSLRHPILGVRAGWDLFARGPHDLVRIQLAAGRITQTYVPTLESGNPNVAFVPEAHDVIIRSDDYVPAYRVPDGGQARLLTGPLAGGGPLIPGPGAQRSDWVLTGSTDTMKLALVSTSHTPAREHIRIAPGAPEVLATAVSDGRGYVLLTDVTFAVHDAGPTWNRIVPGIVVAVGPDDWLTVVCGPRYRHCHNVVVTASTGARRALPGPAVALVFDLPWPPVGVTSPNGEYAAVPEDPGNEPAIYLLNLRTGQSRRLSVPLTLQQSTQSLVWSPDSDWLFAAAAGGKLVAVDISSGRVENVAASLPFVSQVAIRPAP